MAAPTWVAIGALVTRSNAGAVTPAYYAGLAANDIAIIQAAHTDTPTIATPSGWGLLDSTLSGNRRQTFFWKRLVGSESGTVSVTLADAGLAHMFGVRGCITTGDPFEGFASRNGTNTTVGGPAITIGGTERLAIWGFFYSGVGLSGGTFGNPAAGWDERRDANGTDQYVALDTMETSSNVAQASRSGTTAPSGGAWIASGFAMIPVPSAASGQMLQLF